MIKLYQLGKDDINSVTNTSTVNMVHLSEGHKISLLETNAIVCGLFEQLHYNGYHHVVDHGLFLEHH